MEIEYYSYRVSGTTSEGNRATFYGHCSGRDFWQAADKAMEGVRKLSPGFVVKGSTPDREVGPTMRKLKNRPKDF